MSGWAFIAGLSMGFLIGALLLSAAATDLFDDRIKAGAFERKGVAYRIVPLAKGGE